MHKLSALLCVIVLAFLGVFVQADLKTINSTDEFNKTIQEAQVPVIVQFSAYWCGPCQRLKEKLVRIAPEFNDNQVLLCYVDAYVNTELKVYLKGGYPTSRTFAKGKMQEPNFVGDKPEQFVRDFIKGVIANLSEEENELSIAAVEPQAEPGRPDPPKNPAKGVVVSGVEFRQSDRQTARGDRAIRRSEQRIFGKTVGKIRQTGSPV
jgi:thiol-disulfide isomerase/thioredoxin